jgi:hypothetical protein
MPVKGESGSQSAPVAATQRLRLIVLYEPVSCDLCTRVPSAWGRARRSKNGSGSTASPVAPDPRLYQSGCSSLVIDQQESPSSGTNASR